MKKRTLALLLAGTLSLLCACSSSSSTDTSSETATTTTTTTTTDTAADTSSDVAWPEKTVQILVPYTPGGDTDFNARAYATRLEEVLGQSVVVVNVDGNGGAVGSQQAYDSDNDGYTVMFNHTAMLVNEVYGAIDFGPDAFEIACIGGKNAGNVVCVAGDSPYNSLEELIQGSIDEGGSLTFSANAGATTYIMGILLNEAGADMNLVDMGGSSERIAALLGGYVTAIPNPLGTTIPYLESGDFKALALLEEDRNDTFSDIPTANEQGYDCALPIYYFFAFPGGTDQAIVDKFADACEVISQQDDYQSTLIDTYAQMPYFAKGEEATQIMLDQYADIQAMSDLINAAK